MRRALAAAAVLALVLTGCGETDEPAGSSGAASSEPAAGSSGSAESDPAESERAEAIEVEIEGERIEPNGLRVQVVAGETVTLSVKTDRPAEFHVHSSPEQVIEVAPGESTKTLVIERPGLVDVEEHETGLVVLQLEVR